MRNYQEVLTYSIVKNKLNALANAQHKGSFNCYSSLNLGRQLR